MGQPSCTDHLFGVDGKVALVTGGTRGIGLMIARGLVRAGVRTYITSRDAAACAAAADELRSLGQVVALPADLSDEAQAGALARDIAEREPRLHILVNNAGATWGERFDAFPPSGWDKVMNLNLRAVFFLTQQLIGPLRAAATEDDPARVINIGSTDGLTVSPFQNFSYGASKAALHHLSRQMAQHLAADHVNVNVIAPGPFATKMTAGVFQEQGEAIVGQIPRRRYGQEDDIAGAALFLSARASAYITGAVLPVDGGYAATR